MNWPASDSRCWVNETPKTPSVYCTRAAMNGSSARVEEQEYSEAHYVRSAGYQLVLCGGGILRKVESTSKLAPPTKQQLYEDIRTLLCYEAVCHTFRLCLQHRVHIRLYLTAVHAQVLAIFGVTISEIGDLSRGLSLAVVECIY